MPGRLRSAALSPGLHEAGVGAGSLRGAGRALAASFTRTLMSFIPATRSSTRSRRLSSARRRAEFNAAPSGPSLSCSLPCGAGSDTDDGAVPPRAPPLFLQLYDMRRPDGAFSIEWRR